MQPLSDTGDPLIAAFPIALARDAEAVRAVMPASRFRPHAPFPVVVEGRQVSIPGRLYNDEPPPEAVASLSPRQRQLLHCLYSRHHDGKVRQRHLEKVVGCTDSWVVPFVLQLVGEYVVEILAVILDELRELAAPGTDGHLAFGRFIVDNPAFFARTQRRVVSYYSLYYAHDYASRDYPGFALLDVLRSAASDTAGRPWPDLAPVAVRVNGNHEALTGY
ncbi:hypothetical protein [Streptacidiphilus jiangxiensis]|uniref:Uncharacterized protein n=1 Tax=Streptacidiphilus jiangxiensis TaxID=235985 RepID=A0A1H7P1C1_STRJI|nr:hypothetical protein [Streptacidiphilus jiangxiensis]SEL29603.1 hypothetical protein SAMN05414137_107176 [Streptacidiphilus jiangxiensis]